MNSALPAAPCRPRYHGARIARDQRRVFGIALVGAAPAHIAHHGDGWREGPVDTGGGHFLGRCLPDALDQPRVMCGTQPHVVRENRRSANTAVAVNGIDAEQDWYRRMRRRGVGYRCTIERIHQVQPVRSAGAHVVCGRCIAARQDGAELVGVQVLGFDRADIGLHQLADFFLEAHVLQQLVNELFEFWIRCDRRGGCRPLERMDQRACIRRPGRAGAQCRRRAQQQAREAMRRIPAQQVPA